MTTNTTLRGGDTVTERGNYSIAADRRKVLEIARKAPVGSCHWVHHDEVRYLVTARGIVRQVVSDAGGVLSERMVS